MSIVLYSPMGEAMGEYQVHLDAAPGPMNRLWPSGLPRSAPAPGNGKPAIERGAGRDTAEISQAALRFSRSGGVRQDLVERVRQEIADGTYVTPERTDAAAEAMLRALLSG